MILICHYAEQIEDTVKVMGGSEHVNNMEHRFNQPLVCLLSQKDSTNISFFQTLPKIRKLSTRTLLDRLY